MPEYTYFRLTTGLIFGMFRTLAQLHFKQGSLLTLLDTSSPAPTTGEATIPSETSPTRHTLQDQQGLHHHSGASPGFGRGGGQEFFFFRFGNLHVAKRHAAHGEAMRIARGVRGHAPPRKFF